MAKKILIIGDRAREHALAWKLKQSPEAGEIFIAPGNAGTALVGKNVPIEVADIPALLEFAKQEKIDLTVLGSDEPGPLGIVDRFNENGLLIFGPMQKAAEIESSKAFAKQLMREDGIPTAAFEVFTDYDAAVAYANKIGAPCVVKANGLAQGKGAIVCKTLEEARKALREIMVDRVFGDAGKEVVIEEFLEGQEISMHAFSDGETFKLFPTSQDHKPIGEGDTGPNTGGMGTIAPVPWTTAELLEKVKVKVVEPALQGLAKKGNPFAGILYPGLMITPSGSKVLEFNARFGDPEAQVYMRLLKSDLLPILEACATGELDKVDIEWHDGYAACVVIASCGYPNEYKKGFPITGIEKEKKMEDVVVFHAGTKMDNGKLVTSGGRVLSVTATGTTLDEALEKSYAACGVIHFEGMYYRKDIGRRKAPQFLNFNF